MENIKTLKKYNTDTFNSWGIGCITKPRSYTFEEIIKFAVIIKAKVIVKPSRGKYWYLKGINNKKTYEDIKNHLETNQNMEYRKKSKTWLLSYDEFRN